MLPLKIGGSFGIYLIFVRNKVGCVFGMFGFFCYILAISFGAVEIFV